MLRKVGWTFLAVLAVSLPVNSASVAGPYFNADGKEVGAQSRAAVKQLSDARIQVIQMLTELDAGRSDAANAARGQAVKLLQNAYQLFKEIEAKVPAQPLKFNVQSDDEKRAIQDFSDALSARKLSFPKTEKDLAAFAIAIVGRYLTTVSKADLRDFPKNWKGMREIILSEVDLLSIGNLVSVVWTIRQQ